VVGGPSVDGSLELVEFVKASVVVSRGVDVLVVEFDDGVVEGNVVAGGADVLSEDVLSVLLVSPDVVENCVDVRTVVVEGLLVLEVVVVGSVVPSVVDDGGFVVGSVELGVVVVGSVSPGVVVVSGLVDSSVVEGASVVI